MRKWLLIVGCLTVAALVSVDPAFAQVAAPQLTNAALGKPLPLPYHPAADASAEIGAAMSRAKQSGKRVLIDFGANWCPDCRVFAGVAALPEANEFIKDHFELVMVDVGRFDHNMDLSARFAAAKPKGIPTILVVTPDGKLLNGDKAMELSNDRSMTPQAIVDWLALWAKPVS